MKKRLSGCSECGDDTAILTQTRYNDGSDITLCLYARDTLIGTPSFSTV